MASRRGIFGYFSMISEMSGMSMSGKVPDLFISFNAEGLCLFPSQTFVAIDHLCLHFLHICTHPGAIRPHDFPQRLCQDFHLFGAEISPRFLACSSVSLNAKGFNSCHENCRSRQVKGRAESHFRKNDILMAPQWTNLLNLWIYFQQRNFFRLSL